MKTLRGGLLAAALLLAGLPAMAATLQAASPAGLQAALAAAEPGDVIELAAGDYGRVTVTARFSDWVTIRAAVPLGAGFERLSLSGAGYLVLDGLHIGTDAGGGAGEALLAIEGSDHITVQGAEISGPVTGEPVITSYFGIRTQNSSAITITESFAHDVVNGMAFFGISNLRVSGNRVDRVGGDSFKFSGLDGALIDNNRGAALTFSDPKAHEDFMQFQGRASKNVTVRGNVSLPQNVFDIQGIFVSGDGGHAGFLIEENIIHSSMVNGIVVTKDSTGIEIRNNTLLSADGDQVRVSAPQGARIRGNLTSGRRGGGDGSGNLAMQGQDPSAAYYIASLFPGWYPGRGLSLADLAPRPGSPAESMGAANRWRELVN